MYGKLFASTFTGSMMGAGADTFAVWGYAIANADRRGFVELNPRLLAAVIGSTPPKMSAAIEALASPDPDSRTKNEDGRRVIREGTFIYRIVNHPEYRGMRDEDERRSSQRTWARDKRAKSLDAVDQCLPPSTHTEAEVEVETDTDSEGCRWSPLDWRRHFGRFWAEAKGRLAYGVGSGSDGKATGDLGDILSSLPDLEKLKAERLAPDMFRLYLAETGKAASAQHPWSWFVTRFNSLLTDAMKTGKQNSTGFVPSDLPED